MISFIIPAHDEERLIGRTLSALYTAAKALDEPYEIIVVDDASTDATAAVDVVLSRRLQQLGTFVIVREMVVTSGRTVRSHTGIEAFRLLAGFILGGPKSFRTRRGPWYEPRRDDPDTTV